MNINEIKELEHIVVTEQFDNVHIQPEEGYMLTMWNEEDIHTYDAYKNIYLPIKDEYPHIYTITEDEHNAYMEELDAVLKHEMENAKPTEPVLAESDELTLNDAFDEED